MRTLKLKETVGTISRLADASGVGIETVRFYVKKGLLSEPRQRKGKFRVYTQDDLTKIRFIKRAQSLGFTLREIKELIGLAQSRASCSTMISKAETKIEEIEQKILDLKMMNKTLNELSECCRQSKPERACEIYKCFGQKT